jgi:adenylate cyclase class 2
MPIEIEKKYQLNEEQKNAVLKRLAEIGAAHSGEEFEENTLFGSRVIDLGNSVLRLRRTKTACVLTQKQRLPGESAIKYQQENETVVEDGDAMAAILAGLGFSPTLVYEKFRDTWRIDDVEVVVDRLPFGLFMEIEGSESSIKAMEEKLQITELDPEHATYPALARRYGKVTGDLIASRFENS